MNLTLKIFISVIIILLSIIISPLISYLTIKLFNIKEKDKLKIKNNSFFKVLKFLIIVFTIYSTTYFFDIPKHILFLLKKIFKICVIALIAFGFSGLFNSNSNGFSKLKTKFNFNSNDAFIDFICKILKILVYIIAGFLIISELGYNLGGLFTGLGISSVVIALAAQDLAKSLFGGLAILLDRPFNLGDYIKINNDEGTVEDITFRTTRLRNAAKELIIIPNSEISADSIINYNKRNVRQYKLHLVLELSTPLEKISLFKQQLTDLLHSNPQVVNNNIRIFFDTISDNGFDINVSFYTNVFELNDFLQFKENINFEIMNLLINNNINLAYDSKTIYLQNA